MTIRQFLARDYVALAAHAVEGDLKAFMDTPRWADFLWANSLAYTVDDDDGVVLCGGVRRLWGQTGVAWLEANMAASRIARGRAIQQYSKYAFGKIVDDGPFSCVIAEARPEYGNPKMLRRLGFSRLGRIPKYLPNGKDVVLYVWTR
ncbi:MAG: hypothetical protein ACYTAS_20040 [Planctomycetota bacterium]|jgi:hypothetical protein